MRAVMALIALLATLTASAAAQDEHALEHWLHVCQRPQLDYWIQLCARVQARDPSMNRRQAQPDRSGVGEVQADTSTRDGRQPAPPEPHP